MRFQIPNDDIVAFLKGHWKRNLEWREFGGEYKHLRTSNTLILIEEHHKPDTGPDTRHLKWSFGKTLLSDLHFGYIMKAVASPKNPGEAFLEWQHSGTVCHGKFMSASNAIVLNFFLRASSVIVTYRIVDADTIAVSIVEIDDKQPPTIQYGNMYRIDPALYTHAPDGAK